MAKKIMTVLEITETHIKLVQVKEEPQGNVITKFIIENVPSNTDEAVSKKLGDLIKKFNIKPTNLINVIPRVLVTIRNVSLPSQDPQEISKMVELQAVRQIPYSREDIVIDHLIIGKDTSGYSKVLLVVAHKDVINRYLKIISNAQAIPGLFALSSQGVCNWYLTYQNKTVDLDQKVILQMDFDTVNTDICFFHNRQLIFTRSITFGIKDLASQNLENLFQQLHLTISTYKKEKLGQDISKIVLTPSSEHIENLSKRLETEFLVPTEVVEPQVVVPKEKRLTLPNQIIQGEVSSSAILGFAIGKKVGLIDLLPKEVHRKKEVQTKKKKLISLGLLLVLAIVSFASVIFAKIHKKEQYIKMLEASLKQNEPEAKNIALAIKKLELIKQRLNPKVSSIDILYELYNLLPKNMSLSVLEQDDQGNLTLQGVALAMSDVYDFNSLLLKSVYFSNVEVKYTSKRRTREGELTDFRIVCKIAK